MLQRVACIRTCRYFTPNIRPKDCPSSIIHFLKEENIEDVQFFKACWWHPYALCSKYYNYLTQFWAMERMPYKCPQSVVIASGIFEPKNLKAFNDEIGINYINLGWETPGAYDTAVTISNFDIYGIAKN